MSNYILKDLFQNEFKVGAAVSHNNEWSSNREIGTPEKEALIAKHFNSITFENELKPMFNMGFKDPSATEEYLPFVINPVAADMLRFAKEKGIKIRAHVLVWHSQCPKEVFCKGYEPVTFPTDPELLKEKPFLKRMEKLKPECYVDRETMLKRLKSYIYSAFEFIYKNGYADTIYAWDVVNEAIETADKTPTGLRNSYWYQVIGEDFIYWAFRYTKDALLKYSVEYASSYGLNPDDEASLAPIRAKLTYNDYNEWNPDKKAAIIAALQRSTDDHGSILSEKLIDVIGMQGHISDTNDIDEYVDTMLEYSSYVDEVHITELDVKCTCTNVNREYYQAVFYKELFSKLLEANKRGGHLTSVTFWGLTDDTSWIRGADPLLFRSDLSEKKSFLGVVYSITGGELGEPETVIYNLADRCFSFSDPEDATKPVNLETIGFKMRGFGQIQVQDKVTHSAGFALAQETRFDNWSYISFDASDFIGQTFSVRSFVKTEAPKVQLMAEINGNPVEIASVDTSSNQWTELSGTFKAPGNLHALPIFFHVEDADEEHRKGIYVDDVSLKLIGLEESFEEENNIAAIRGAGHLPVLSVVTNESHTPAGHSLLITRQEKDATVKLNISSYIGHSITFTAFVKTNDQKIRVGLDGATSTQLAEFDSNQDGWTKVTVQTTLADSLRSAEIYIETDGNADYYLDDILVTREAK